VDQLEWEQGDEAEQESWVCRTREAGGSSTQVIAGLATPRALVSLGIRPAPMSRSVAVPDRRYVIAERPLMPAVGLHEQHSDSLVGEIAPG
jgi:hypothetical protein